MPKYKVLRRIDAGKGRMADNKWGYTVYFPKDDPVPKDVKPDRIGVPRSMDIQGGPHKIELTIDRSGWITADGEQAENMISTGAIEPRTKAERKFLRPTGPEKRGKEAEPMWVKTARGAGQMVV
jgi:hypothetical protein